MIKCISQKALLNHAIRVLKYKAKDIECVTSKAPHYTAIEITSTGEVYERLEEPETLIITFKTPKFRSK